jgi:hypothetical protein
MVENEIFTFSSFEKPFFFEGLTLRPLQGRGIDSVN